MKLAAKEIDRNEMHAAVNVGQDGMHAIGDADR